MNKRTLLAAAFAAFFSLALALNAADEPKKKGPGFADINGGQDFTKEQYCKAMKTSGTKMDDAALEKRFDAMDANKDKKVTQEEWKNAPKGGKKKA